LGRKIILFAENYEANQTIFLHDLCHLENAGSKSILAHDMDLEKHSSNQNIGNMQYQVHGITTMYRTFKTC
jgi:hypothetical protein